MIDASQVDQYFDTAKKLTLEAGKLIVEGIDIDKHVEFKHGDWDLVTKYDGEVEQILIDGLKKTYPDHKFIAEETSALTDSIPKLTDEPTWIIDPIDGTTNFVHGYPQTCISIGLAINKQMQLAIIYNPSYNEMYTAKRGRGAYLNEKRIKTSTITTIKKAVVASEPSVLPLSPSNREIALARAELLATEAQGVRNNGSAALLLAYVARGILDCFQCMGMKPWDLAAGVLLVEEAGGIVCDSKGGPFDLFKSGLIAAANVPLATEMSKLIIEVDLKTQRKRLKRS